ncbi:MAG TPA: hypothetical protein ENI23_12870 [bacterium]|nr:hypothetical protein [bacterium]
MFFCDDCAKKKGWETSWLRSFGPCEICHITQSCSDVKSNHIEDIHTGKLEPITNHKKKYPNMELTPKGKMSIATNQLKDILEYWEKDHEDVKDIEEYKQVIIRMGTLLELLIYPYLIEPNTVKNLLEVLSGEKIGKISNLRTDTVHQVSNILKTGKIPSDEIKKLIEESKK